MKCHVLHTYVTLDNCVIDQPRSLVVRTSDY
jgi:hypothetical protein